AGVHAGDAGPRRGARPDAARRREVVRHPVAVVVESIADLGRGIDVAYALDRPARAGVRSGRADALLARRAGRAGAGIAVVDRAVAVVVGAVADLGSRRSRHARVDAREAHPGRAARADAAARREVVHRPVAIVVEVVADLGRGIHVAHALER